jgi:hypothetical protein
MSHKRRWIYWVAGRTISFSRRTLFQAYNQFGQTIQKLVTAAKLTLWFEILVVPAQAAKRLTYCIGKARCSNIDVGTGYPHWVFPCFPLPFRWFLYSTGTFKYVTTTSSCSFLPGSSHIIIRHVTGSCYSVVEKLESFEYVINILRLRLH